MKELTVIDEKGSYKINGKSTIIEITKRFEVEKAREVIEKYLEKRHVCDLCKSDEKVTYIRVDKEYLCQSCNEDW